MPNILILAAVPFLITLAVAGFNDWKSRKVPDFILSIMWITMMFAGSAPMWAAGLFGLLFFANTFYLSAKGKPMLEWGDILAAPPALGVMFAVSGFFWSMLWLVITFGAILLYFSLKRQVPKDDPIVTYITVACFLAFLPQLL
jgi:hypothetical protein